MNNLESICCFAEPHKNAVYVCAILKVETCSGKDTSCKFFKTKEELNADRDDAIDRCREKNICKKCKYREKPCIKSSEHC